MSITTNCPNCNQMALVLSAPSGFYVCQCGTRVACPVTNVRGINPTGGFVAVPWHGTSIPTTPPVATTSQWQPSGSFSSQSLPNFNDPDVLEWSLIAALLHSEDGYLVYTEKDLASALGRSLKLECTTDADTGQVVYIVSLED